ncbi:Type II intron maturase [Nonomuraea solani]|uniref:Type II intron maturase n=1 Tax=Nonomuraea solani TaxID=1144553 RepID=A0A1H6EA67_9ACTN|nr:Type II intron maturase [Nonomuraea solani]
MITHARTGAAKFLGYEITVQHGDQRLTRGRRAVNGIVRLRVPKSVIKAASAPYLQHGNPERRTELMNFDDHTIISTYGAQYRGIVQYYLLAGDVHRLNRLRWVMQTSLLKTLAAKHRSTVSKTARRYRDKIPTPHGPRTCIQVSIDRGNGRKPLVARFGGIPLKRQRMAVLIDRPPGPGQIRRKELITRLLAGRRELCGNVNQPRSTTSTSSPTSASRDRPAPTG